MFQSDANKESWGIKQSESSISILRPRQVKYRKHRCSLYWPIFCTHTPGQIWVLTTHPAHFHYVCTKLELNLPLSLSPSSIYHPPPHTHTETDTQSVCVHPSAGGGQRSIFRTFPQDPPTLEIGVSHQDFEIRLGWLATSSRLLPCSPPLAITTNFLQGCWRAISGHYAGIKVCANMPRSQGSSSCRQAPNQYRICHAIVYKCSLIG